jgi:hypothetical protein
MITLSNLKCIEENFVRFILLHSVQKQNSSILLQECIRYG